MEFGVLMKCRMHDDIEKWIKQISWGDYSHINDHKINSVICLQ